MRLWILRIELYDASNRTGKSQSWLSNLTVPKYLYSWLKKEIFQPASVPSSSGLQVIHDNSLLRAMATDHSSSSDDNDDNDKYIRTATHNYVSRAAIIKDPSRVELKGKSVLKPNVTIRSDLAVVRMGRYCWVDQDTEICPASQGSDGQYIPVMMRGNVVVERGCRIEASAIGTNVYIGAGSRIGQRVIVKDCCWIEPGTVLGNDTVVPPFSRVEGQPGQVTEELPSSAATDLQELAQQTYQQFLFTHPNTT